MSENTYSSTSTVTVDRAPRYAKQLVSHMGRKFGGEWDKDTATGHIILFESRVNVAAPEDNVITFQLQREGEDDLEMLEDAVGRHLVRFAHDQHLVVTWQRADGSAGTVQETGKIVDPGERPE